MFKKIEIWILYLTILLSILFAVGFGVLVRQELVGGIKAGWVSKTALNLAEIPVKLKQAFIGLKVEDRFPNLDGFNGTPNSEESYLLLSRYDGDLKEGVVELVDLRTFEILHTWNPDIDAFNSLVKKLENPEFKNIQRDANNSRHIIRHPKLSKNGNLFWVYGGPLHGIDACSNLVFQNTHNHFHHSIEFNIDNDMWVPSHISPYTLETLRVGNRFLEDGITKLSLSDEILFEKSIIQIFIENGLEYLLFSVGDSHSAGAANFDTDPIHINDIQPVNFDGEFWKKGDVFLSMRHQSMVMLYRPSTNEIIWKGTGPFFHQHDIDILDSQRISIFNNNSKDFVNADVVDGHNEVIIYDFKANEYSSYFKDSLIENEVKTITQGRSEILTNGDLFIEESNYGRTLYFNSDGSLRWTHVNRAKNGGVYAVGWSRILFTEEDFKTVNNFLTSKGTCNE
tara:strand:- start:838 stop:2196 length:1359 start_codon:yes stop_codon:yes gene_type:complete